MNILITGATGFLGSHVGEAFQQRGDNVIAMVRSDSQGKTLLPSRVAALDQPEQLRRAMAGIDVVVHAAAKVETFGPWSEFVRTTVDGTRNVLEAATDAGVGHFIHISSRGVYERPAREDILYKETLPYGRPYRWSYYARAKIEAEKIVRAARIKSTILRPTWVYGPRDKTILPRIIEALRSQRYRWIGDGMNRLNLIYVSDVANAIVATSRQGGHIYNVSDDENSVTQREFITRICELSNLPLPTRSLSYQQAHCLGFLGECAARFGVRLPMTRLSALLLGGHRRFSNEKLRSELGWAPVVPFEQGIRLALHATDKP